MREDRSRGCRVEHTLGVELVVKRLADDYEQHRTRVECAESRVLRKRLYLDRRDEVSERGCRRLCVGTGRIEIDQRVEVILGRGIRLGVSGGQESPVALACEQVVRVRGCTGDAVAVQHGDRRLLRGRRLGAGFCSPSRLDAERCPVCGAGDRDVWMCEAVDGLPNRCARRVELVGAADVHARDGGIADVVLNQMAGGEKGGEERVAKYRCVAETGLACGDPDVSCDRRDDLGQLHRVEVLGDLVLEGTEELLLACLAVEVGIGVAEADELECAAAAQELVAGLEVDVGVVGRRRADVLVVVRAIDVQPDAAEIVDDLLEPVETDRDQVIDLEPGEPLDRVERSGCAAIGERVVDPSRRERHGVARAVDGDLKVAWEREQRDRVRARIGADEQDRVRTPASVRLDPGAFGCHRARALSWPVPRQRRGPRRLLRGAPQGPGCSWRPLPTTRGTTETRPHPAPRPECENTVRNTTTTIRSSRRKPERRAFGGAWYRTIRRHSGGVGTR